MQRKKKDSSSSPVLELVWSCIRSRTREEALSLIWVYLKAKNQIKICAGYGDGSRRRAIQCSMAFFSPGDSCTRSDCTRIQNLTLHNLLWHPTKHVWFFLQEEFLSLSFFTVFLFDGLFSVKPKDFQIHDMWWSGKEKRVLIVLLTPLIFYAPTAIGGEEFSIMHYHPRTYYA